MIEAVNSAHSLAKGKVTWQDYVLAAERDDERALRRPRAYPRDLGEYRNKLFVWQRRQRLGSSRPSDRRSARSRSVLIFRQDSPASRKLAGSVPSTSAADGRRPPKRCLDAREDPAGCRDRQLLADDLEQQGTKQVHRRQLSYPPPRVEIRPVSYELGQHRISLAQISPRQSPADQRRPASTMPSPIRRRHSYGYSFRRRSVRTISTTSATVSWRAQSR